MELNDILLVKDPMEVGRFEEEQYVVLVNMKLKLKTKTKIYAC